MAGAALLRVLAPLLCLLTLSTPLGLSPECNKIRLVHGTMSKEILTLLSKMRLPPRECPHEYPNFQFPTFLIRRKKVPTRFIPALLHYARKIYSYSPNNTKHSELQQLLATMSEHWAACLYKKKKKTFRPKSNKKALAISKYFHSMERFLEEKDCSPCAWMAVNKEVRKVMHFVTRQIDILRKPNALH